MVAFRLHGYRRFETQETLDLTPRVVALVGPNEAGKSSLLKALEQLTDPGDVEFASSDFTGRQRPDGSKEIVSALFELEESDRQALAGIPEAANIRNWRLTRNADGEVTKAIEPPVKRDRTSWEGVRKGLERLLTQSSRKLQALLGSSLDEHEVESPPVEDTGEESVDPFAGIATVRELGEAVQADLERHMRAFSGDVRRRLRGLKAVLDEVEDRPRYVGDLATALESLADYHDQPHPGQRAFQILDSRCPQVRVMRDSDRQLTTSYGFDEYGEEGPPAPLANLLTLADLDWDTLKAAAAEPANPELRTMLTRGNRRLAETLNGTWRQAEVSVELEEQSGALNVYPYDADSDVHSRVEERSDGFRSFLGLLAFTSVHSMQGRKLILGIDEAEAHLHYDAQADLIDVLTRQTLVPQIVYSTHSAGCLPEDFGSAIRVLKPVPRDRTKIENGFWSTRGDEGGTGGFTSLLMAMGAGAVAFTPTRRAVIAEGPSDALLLPALLRVAAGLGPDERLGLQVSGGLAWTPPKRLGVLEAEAAHVVYLTDSDHAGKDYRDDLLAAEVDEERIFMLPDGRGDGLSIEDFVDTETYVGVFNYLAKKLHEYEGDELTSDDLPDFGLAAAAKAWGAAHGIVPELSKTAIAEHLLRVSFTSLAYMYWDDVPEQPAPLIREERRDQLKELHADLVEALGVVYD
jgi:energy-coupling factor transporter ATP-binding protein EcfA2